MNRDSELALYLSKAEECSNELRELDEKNIGQLAQKVNQLNDIYNDCPNVEIAELLSESQFNLIFYYLELDQLTESLRVLEDLNILEKSHPKNECIMWQLSHILTNAISTISDANLEKALSVFEYLKLLFIRYPDDGVVADRVVDGCYNLQIELKDTDFKKTHELITLMFNVQKQFNTYTDLTQLFMQAGLNFTNFFIEEETEKVLFIYDRMKEVPIDFENFEGYENIVYELVKASSKVTDVMVKKDVNVALRSFDILKKYSKEDPDDIDTVSRTATAAYNLIVILKDTDIKQCKVIFKILEDFHEQYDDETIDYMYSLTKIVIE